MFCVQCGAKGRLIEKLCPVCYSEAADLILLPPTIEVDICPKCASYRQGDKWNYFNGTDELFDKTVMAGLRVDSHLDVGNIELDHHKQDELTRRITVNIEGDLGGMHAEEDGTVTVKLKKGECSRCSRIAGKYHEGILQVRGERGTPSMNKLERIGDMAVEEIKRSSEKDRASFISDIRLDSGGLDIFMGKVSDARRVAAMIGSEFNSKVNSSRSLVGRKDGREVYRMTYIVRLPPYGKGDYLVFEDTIWKVERLAEKYLKLRNLDNEEIRKIRRNELNDYEVLEGADIPEKAVMVSRSEDRKEIKVLHPHTYSTVVLRVPEGRDVSPENGEVDVIVHGDDLYLP